MKTRIIVAIMIAFTASMNFGLLVVGYASIPENNKPPSNIYVDEMSRFELIYNLYLPVVMRDVQQSEPSTWQLFSSPITDSLNALDLVTPLDGWAVGAAGMILHWNGTSWSKMTSPTSSTINSVDLLDSSIGWAVGENGLIIRFNGNTWENVISPSPANLNKVSILAEDNAWAVGDGGVMLHWDGNQWNTEPALTTFDLEALAFIDATNGWAIGAVWLPGQVLDYDNIFLHWDGNIWTDATPRIAIEDIVFDLDFVNPDFGIAVGNNNIEFRWINGNWNERGDLPMMHYRAVDLLTATDGWAVGWVYQQDNIQRWNGVAWVSTPCPTDNRLNDVHAIDANTAWAVGEEGTILRFR